jgi:hypothetical protein
MERTTLGVPPFNKGIHGGASKKRQSFAFVLVDKEGIFLYMSLDKIMAGWGVYCPERRLLGLQGASVRNLKHCIDDKLCCPEVVDPRYAAIRIRHFFDENELVG